MELLYVVGIIGLLAVMVTGVRIFRSIRRGRARTVTVSISVNPTGMPSSFNLERVQSILQSQVSARVFNNLEEGQQVVVNIVLEDTSPGTLGWSGSPRSNYVGRVEWRDPSHPIVVPGVTEPAVAFSGGDVTSIDPGAAGRWEYPGEKYDWDQLWANVLAHEVIWLNAADKSDTYFSRAEGELSSGVAAPRTPFTVCQRTRNAVIEAFELKQR